MKITGFILSIFAIWACVIFFESDENYLKKTTEKLIRLSTPSSQSLTDLQILRQAEQITKHIYFDVIFEIQMDKLNHKSSSLNEIRSLLFSYFKYRFVVDFKTSNLVVKIGAENRAIVFFDIILKTKSKNFTCKSQIGWIKEKSWFIKTIKVSSCFLISL